MQEATETSATALNSGAVPLQAATSSGAAPRSPYLKPKAAADYLGTSPSTLAKWRMTGYGPAYACLGTRGPIIYREDDLRAFAEQRRRTSTSEEAPRAA